MVAPLLQTKLFIPPPRPALVPRARLINRLNEALPEDTGAFARSLTLISAPAGFGKTTLISSWLHHMTREPRAQTARPRPAWLSLDARDSDLSRFLTYVIAALQTVQPTLGEAALTTLQSARRPPTESILTSLINDVARPARGGGSGEGDGGGVLPILVLDDYHTVTAQPVHDAVAFLLENLPPNLHLIVVTRADPPLPVARLRGQGRVTELRQSDLRFSVDEASAFLNKHAGLQLSPEDVAALEARTEGWIAGLQMAALALHSPGATGGRDDVSGFVRALTGSDRYILDYLVEEVLKRQPEGVQRFLLRTSILERLTGPLCDAVLGQITDDWQGQDGSSEVPTTGPPTAASGRDFLSYLDRNNVFVVPLDAERRWYRYHRLFADCLRARLRHSQPGLVPQLHRRASLWYKNEGLTDEAIEHALSAGASELAAELVERVAESTMLRSEWGTFVRWVEALPQDALAARPRLRVYQALALLLGGHPLDMARSHLQEATEADADGALTGEVTAFRALIAAYRGERKRSTELAEEALGRLPEDSLFFRSFIAGFLGLAHLYIGDVEAAGQAFREAVRVSERTGNVNISVLARYHLADLASLAGRVDEAETLYREALSAAVDEQGRRRPVAGIALIGLGRLEAERYELDAAARHLSEGIELIERWGEAGAISGYTGQARVRAAQGDIDGALEAIESAHRLAERFDAMEVDDVSVAVARARFQIAQGSLEAPARWAEERGLTAELTLQTLYDEISSASSLYRFFEYTTFAWLRIAQNRPAEALAVLEPLVEAAEASGWLVYGAEALILKGLVLQAQGDEVRALNAIGRALSAARPGGFVRLFVEKGAPMARLLYRAAEEGIEPQFAGRLLTAFPEPQAPEPFRDASTGQGALIEPLSDRELEVLELVADGLSNREIAQTLYLSVNTVKVHTSNIYGKLGVHSRTQAVAKARAVGILPPVR